MKDRLKHLRNELKLTQAQIAEKIGIDRGSWSNYEIGRNKPLDTVIKSICREFSVNEEWLTEGKGEMFNNVPLDEEILRKVTRLLTNESEKNKLKIVNYFLNLNEAEIDLLIKKAEELVNYINKED